MRKDLLLHIVIILWAIWRRRYLIAVPILFMPVVGLTIGLLSPKKYETYTTILFQETAKQNPFLEDLAVATNLKSRMEALNALLHSRHILSEAAISLNLIDTEMSETERRGKIAQLAKSLTSRLVGEDLIKITYTAGAPENMSETLTLISQLFVERVIAPQRSSILQSESFLKSELDKRLEGLTKAEQGLSDYKRRFANELPDLNPSNITRLSHLRSLLIERQTELQGAKAAEKMLKSRLAQTNPVIGKIEESIIEKVSELASLRSRYTDKHTKIQALLSQLTALKAERTLIVLNSPNLADQNLDRLWNMAASSGFETQNGVQPLLISQLERLQDAQSLTDSLTEEISNLNQELVLLKKKAKNFSEHERRLNELNREINVQRKIYGNLAERHQLARVTGALGKYEENDRVKLIDPPFKPLAPSNLPLVMYLIAGLFGGIVFGSALAFVFEILSTSVRRRDTLSRVINAPVFIRIPPLKD